MNPHRDARTGDPARVPLAAVTDELPESTVGSVRKILSAVRAHLDMDVAFVSEFVGEDRHFRHVDAKGRSPIREGDVVALEHGYCRRVVEGTLPELIVDTACVPAALALPETRAIPIGSHLSVPIRLKNGDVYGTFCCFNFATDPTLNARDLHFMRAFADVAAFQIDRDREVSASRTEIDERIAGALRRGEPSMVYQPVIALRDLRVVGFECLARFGHEPRRAPDRWFAEAAGIGRRTALEVQAIANGLGGLRDRGLPATMGIWLNLSAATLVEVDVAAHFGDVAPDRIVLELTEHDHVSDYAALARALQPLRARGVRVAIDDAGAGYSSMSHILNIAPDHIKLDISLTREIDTDRKRRALAAALIEFGRQTDCTIVAEGVESAAQLNALRELGVDLAQGWFLGDAVGAESVTTLVETFGSRPDLAFRLLG